MRKNLKVASIKKYIRIFVVLIIFILISFVLETNKASADTTLSPSDCSGGCQDEISRALASGGPVVTLTPGTYWIDSRIDMPAGRTLQGTRTGKYAGGMGSTPSESTEAIIKMRTGASPLIGGSGANVKIQGFTIDGNCDALGTSACARGSSGNVLMALNGNNLLVNNMYMRDSGLDGVRVRRSAGVVFSNNVVWRMGHEALYTLSGSSNIEAFNNEVLTWTNSSFRLAESHGGNIHDNVIYSRFSSQSGWTGSSTGPGIEINESYNVNIHHNSIQTIRGSGIWVTTRYSSRPSYGITIACNAFQTVGKYNLDNGYSTGGILLGNVQGTVIENNIIDNAGGGGSGSDNGGAVQHSVYVSRKTGERFDLPGTYTTYVRNNIIRNSTRGLYNHPSFTLRGNHYFVSENNCFDNIKLNRYYAGDNTSQHTGDTYSGCAATLECTATLPTLPTDPSTNTPVEDCDNGADDDGDGKVDCSDSDCTQESICAAPPYSYIIDQKPIADAGTDINTIVGRTITLNGSGSKDDRGITSYSWDFNNLDGIQSNATGVTAAATYSAIGKYTVTLTVTDTGGNISTNTITVTVCGAEADRDNDGYLNSSCGGDDCDDDSSSVRPGTACLNKCFGDIIMGGLCQAGTGVCDYSTNVSTCTNLGNPCRLDRCDDSSGVAACVIDFSDDFCGGILPCGRKLDNPTTTDNNETDSCSLCHIAMLSNNSIRLMTEIASIMALLALIISGLLYVMSAGNPEKKNNARGYVMATIKGFAAVFLAWLIVDFILSAWGFIDPLGGNWNVICDLFFPVF